MLHDEGRPQQSRPTPITSNQSVHDAHGWRAVARNGRVYLHEIEWDRDPGLSHLQAMELAVAILEAAYAAKRGGRQ